VAPVWSARFLSVFVSLLYCLHYLIVELLRRIYRVSEKDCTFLPRKNTKRYNLFRTPCIYVAHCYLTCCLTLACSLINSHEFLWFRRSTAQTIDSKDIVWGPSVLDPAFSLPIPFGVYDPAGSIMLLNLMTLFIVLDDPDIDTPAGAKNCSSL
jgi:hypothetical protein